MYAEMRAGSVTPNGGVYLQMAPSRSRQRAAAVQGHGRALRRLRLRSRRRPCRSGPDRALHDGRRRVRRRLHDRADADCSRPARIPGGVHGANRLGGNGVANSTVFGGIAGETMAAWVDANPEWRAPDIAAVGARDRPRARRRFACRREPRAVRARRCSTACGTTSASCARAEACERAIAAACGELDAELDRTGVAGSGRDYNVSWHDWLNLKSLIAVSARHRDRGARARELARRALSRGFSGGRGSRDLFVHGRAPAWRLRSRSRTSRARFTRVKPGERCWRRKRLSLACGGDQAM